VPVTVTTGKLNPFDTSGNPPSGSLKIDVSNMIDLVAPERDVPFLSMLGFGATAEQIASASAGAHGLRDAVRSVSHSWGNDVLVPTSGTITANHADAGGVGVSTALTVGATQVAYFRVDDIIRLFSSDATVANVDKDVFYLVTAVGATTITVTSITADQPSTSGDSWYKMGQAKLVGAAANTTGKTTNVTYTTNHTQIFNDDAMVTGTEESTERYGITDPMAREIDKTFQKLVVEFERACTYGYRTSALPADSTTASRMGGFFYYTRIATGGLSADLAGAPIDENTLDTYIDTLWRAGGNPTVLMMNSVALRELKKFNRPFTQTTRTERTAGLIVDRYESAQGISLDVMLNRHLGNGDILIISKDQLGVGPLSGNGNARSFAAREIPWDGGDYRRFDIRGEYSMEVRNNTTHHIWLYGGSSTVST
jgi:hypothetical protein